MSETGLFLDQSMRPAGSQGRKEQAHGAEQAPAKGRGLDDASDDWTMRLDQRLTGQRLDQRSDGSARLDGRRFFS